MPVRISISKTLVRYKVFHANHILKYIMVFSFQYFKHSNSFKSKEVYFFVIIAVREKWLLE